MTEPHQDVTRFIESTAPQQREIMNSLRRLVNQVAPETVEQMKWGHPVYTLHGLLCYFSPAQEYVTFGFFNGSRLPDPENILQGNGKKLRHVKIYSKEEIPMKQIEQLLRAAVQLNFSK